MQHGGASERRAQVRAAAAIAIATVTVLAIAAVTMLLGRGSPPRGSAPAVYYQVDGGRETALWVRELDGTSQPRRLASRPAGTLFFVAPDGQLALSTRAIDDVRHAVEAIDLATGGVAWRTEMSAIADPVWHGSTRFYGFTAAGDPLLAANGPENPRRWAFEVVDWRAGGRRPASAAEIRETRAQALGVVGYSAAAGRTVALEIGPGPDRIIVRTLEGRELTDLGAAPEGRWDWVAIDARSTVLATASIPDGDGFRSALYAWDADGNRRLIAGNLPAFFAPEFSPGGTMLVVNGWLSTEGRSVIGIIDLRVDRLVPLPLPERLVEARIAAVIDGSVLPDVAVAPIPPVVAPTPRPSPAIVPGAPAVLVSRVEEEADGTARLHVGIVVPATDGGVVEIAAMPMIEPLGPSAEPGFRALYARPRPGSDEILVWLNSQELIEAWLWTPGEEARPVDLPPTIAGYASNPIWRPDGAAFVVSGSVEDGDRVRAAAMIVDVPAVKVRIVPLSDDYSDVVGWAPNGHDLILGHVVCIEGCPGRYAHRATLTLDGDLRPIEVGDVDLGLVAFDPSIRGGQPPGIELSSIADEAADDIRVTWAGRPPADRVRSAFLADGSQDLVIVDASGEAIALYRAADPLAVVVDGIATVQPALIGSIPEGFSIAALDPGFRWLLSSDGTRMALIVDLSTGTIHEVATEVELTWR